MRVEAAIEEALLTRLAALALSPPLPVDWPQMPLNPAGTAYLEVRSFTNPTRRLLINTGATRQYTGFLQVTILTPVTPAGTQESALRDIGGAILDHFPEDVAIRLNGVSVTPIERGSVADAYRDGAYLRTPITIHWRCFAP